MRTWDVRLTVSTRGMGVFSATDHSLVKLNRDLRDVAGHVGPVFPDDLEFEVQVRSVGPSLMDGVKMAMARIHAGCLYSGVPFKEFLSVKAYPVWDDQKPEG